MGVNIQKKKLSDFRSEESLRNDYKYISSFETSSKDFYSYRQLFDFVPYKSIDITSHEKFKYAEIGNVNKFGEVEPVELSFDDRQEENESLFKKIEKGDIIKPLPGDVLISKIRPYLNKNVLVDSEETYFTKAFIHIRPKINAELFFLALRTKFINQINAVSRQGKGYPTIKEDDLKSIRFPKSIVDALVNSQSELIEKIRPLKQEIANLKETKKQPLNIINQVFGEEFGFDGNYYKEFGKGMTAGTQHSNPKEKSIYKVPFSSIAKSNILRVSCRFHNPKIQFLYERLHSKPILKIKNILLEEAHRGVSPQYDTDGNIPVIKTAHLKNESIEISEDEFVNEDFYKKSIRSQVFENDVLIASTGKVSLGKVDIVLSDQNLVVDGHITILKVNQDLYNPLFLTYFLRSILGAFQIERDFTGATNQIELYSSEIENFEIPDFTLEEQTEIVEKIKTQLDEQKVIDRQIEEKQQAINKIIEDAIKQEQN